MRTCIVLLLSFPAVPLFAQENAPRAGALHGAFADEYVWIYSETPRWWTDAGPPAKLPEAYAEALRRAKGGGREPLDE